ncbi:MAG: hypothetical protein ACLTLV_00125 [Dialister invisus]
MEPGETQQEALKRGNYGGA